MRRGLVIVVTALALHACSSSYVTRGDGGTAAPEAGDDAGSEPESGLLEGGDATQEGGTCVSVPTPSLPSRGGPACPSDASACFPADMTSYIPRWVPPLAGLPHLGACTSTQIADALTACFSTTSTPSTCSPWTSANTTCSACLMTPATASNFGAVIVSGTEDLVNLGACVTLAEPCNAACGEAVQADRLCSFAACDPTQGPCLVTSTASLAAFNACESEADTTCGACSGFGNAATQCLDALVADSSKHAAATLCGLGSSDFNSRYTAVASFLCGP